MSIDLRDEVLNAVQDGRFDEAADLLREMLDAEPDDAGARAFLALCLSERGLHGEDYGISW